MKFSVSIDDLKSAVSFLQPFIGTARTVVDSTQGVLLRIRQDSLLLEATNFERACVYRLPVETQESGICLVRGDQFVRTVQAYASGGELSCRLTRFFEVKGKGRFVSKLGLLNPEEFPNITRPPEDAGFVSVDRERFVEMVSRLRFAADPSSSEGVARIVFFEKDWGFATDGYKIAMWSNPGLGLDRITIPADPSSERIISEMEDRVDLFYRDDSLFLRDAHRLVTLRSPMADPPNIHRLLDRYAEPSIVYDVDSEELTDIRQAIRKSSIVSSAILFLLRPNGIGFVGVEEGAESVSFVDVRHVAWKAPQKEYITCFGFSLLSPALSKLDQAELCFFGEGSPILVVSGDYRSLVQKRLSAYEHRVGELMGEVLA